MQKTNTPKGKWRELKRTWSLAKQVRSGVPVVANFELGGVELAQNAEGIVIYGCHVAKKYRNKILILGNTPKPTQQEDE